MRKHANILSKLTITTSRKHDFFSQMPKLLKHITDKVDSSTCPWLVWFYGVYHLSQSWVCYIPLLFVVSFRTKKFSDFGCSVYNLVKYFVDLLNTKSWHINPILMGMACIKWWWGENKERLARLPLIKWRFLVSVITDRNTKSNWLTDNSATSNSNSKGNQGLH